MSAIQPIETAQHLCQRVSGALMVIHHYNRATARKGCTRFAGAGPTEWVRVLIGCDVGTRYTDAETQEARVTTRLSAIGREMAEQDFRMHRRIRAENPDDLDSPSHYRVEVLTEEPEAASESAALDGLGPPQGRWRCRLAAWESAGHTRAPFCPVVAPDLLRQQVRRTLPGPVFLGRWPGAHPLENEAPCPTSTSPKMCSAHSTHTR
jgi:hypothetical protein